MSWADDPFHTELVERDLPHIIEVRLAENAQKEQAAVNRAKKDRILAIMAEKEDDSLKGASMDELKRMLADL